MNPGVILALIADLYAQVTSTAQALETANARIAELEAQVAATVRQQCPECGAWDGEWCDSGCVAHAENRCGLPHPLVAK